MPDNLPKPCGKCARLQRTVFLRRAEHAGGLDAERAQVQHAAQTIQAEQAGQPAQPFVPPPPQSTIAPQPLDYHFWEFVYCQAWLSSPECQRELENGNEAGVANVRAHAMEHWQMKDQVQWPTGAPAPPPMPGIVPRPPVQPGIGVPKPPSAAPALLT